MILGLVFVFGSILISMTLHEAMHGYVSYWLGDDTAKREGRLTLNPLAHIDPMMTLLLPLMLFLLNLPPFGAAKPVPFNPSRLKYEEFGAALVGLAGPLTNLVLAAVGGALLQVFGVAMGPVLAGGLQLFVLVNVSFCLFNLIPFPPLDGSRVLYAFAPEPVQRVMERIENMGFFAILFFFLIFYTFLAHPFSVLVEKLFTVLTGVAY